MAVRYRITKKSFEKEHTVGIYIYNIRTYYVYYFTNIISRLTIKLILR